MTTSTYNRIAQLNNILSVAPYNLIGYWRCADPPGSSIVSDASGENNTGVWTGATLGAPGLGDTRTSVWLDGDSSGNVFSSALAADFNGDEGTLIAFGKVNDADVWTDGIARRLAYFAVNSNNRVYIGRSSTSNQLSARYQSVGATLGGTIGQPVDPLDWFCIAITWSKAGNVVHAYIDGVLVGTYNGLGTWSGTLTTALIGGTAEAAPVAGWKGWEGHIALYDTPLSGDLIADISIPDADPVATTPVTPAHTTEPLVTLEQVRQELKLEQTTNDQRLIRFIAQAHSAIVLKLGFDYPRGIQTRWVDTAADPRLPMPGGGAMQVLEVIEDGTVLESSAYELDPDDGRSLLRLDSSGRPQRWIAGDRMVKVTYLPVRPPQALIGAEMVEVIRLFRDSQAGYADRVSQDGTTQTRYSHKLSHDTLDIIESLQNKESVGIF